MPRRPINIENRETTIVVRGNARMLLQDGGFRGIYAGTVRGWILNHERLPDLLAYLDHRRVPYRLTGRQGAE
jgi:hypothetical protein